MKAFLLAAGHGTRLRPITDTLPKCLAPIQGIPMLEIWLQQCERAGIHEVVINLHAHADQVRAYLQKHPRAVTVRLVEEEVLLGSAGTLYSQRDWVRDEEEFFVLYSDVLTSCPLERILHFHRQRKPPLTLGVYKVADPRRCGVALTDSEGRIVEFEEKPSHPRGNQAFAGIFVAGREFLQALPQTTPADIAYDVLPQFIGRMYAYPISEYLIDIGTMPNYQMAQQTWPGMEDGTARC